MRILKKIKGEINEHTLWEGGSQFSTSMGFFPASSFSLSSSGRRTEIRNLICKKKDLGEKRT
jgi:hypothetical protein